MITHDDNDQDSPLNQQLTALYRQQATEQPSPQLDDKILALAKKQSTEQQVKTKKQIFLPYSVAASMALATILFISFPQYYQLSSPDIAPDIELLPSTNTTNTPIEPIKNQPATLKRQAAPPTTHQRTSDPLAMDTAAKQHQSSEIELAEFSRQPDFSQIELLLSEHKEQQAIEQLKLIKRRYPNFVLPPKYQKLITLSTTEPNNE
jgi:hypothetical protein